LSDNYYPGWKAYIDGAQTDVLRANHTMRAVKLPGGTHVVSFDFDPAALRISSIVSLIAAAVVAIVFALLWMKEKRRAVKQR
jgi:uncharacterized membrane protein YfhO